MPAEGTTTSGARRRWVTGEPRQLVFDVLVDGRPVRRGVPVRVVDRAIEIGEESVSLDTIFWVSRRAGLVLLFARDRTLALLGASGDLEELARTVERGSDRAAQRSLLQPLAREVVVCTAGTAVRGGVDGDDLSGLHLAVFTQRGLHLFAGTSRRSIAWPVDRVSEINTSPGEPGRAGLRLVGEDVRLTLRYLFPEEIQAVARVARRAPPPEDVPEKAFELFAKGEVDRAPAAELPELKLSPEALQDDCAEAAVRIAYEPIPGGSLDRASFERHFRELGEIALGPLMLRRSAAASATSLAHAVAGMDAEQLKQDADAAFHAVIQRTFEVYGGEIERLMASRRPATEARDDLRAAPARLRVTELTARRMEDLAQALERVLARQHLLMQRLHAREHAPPDVPDTGVDEATEAWQKAIARLDRAYGDAWRGVLSTLADAWREDLAPRLREVAARPSRRLSEGAQLAILAAITFAVMAGLAWWIF